MKPKAKGTLTKRRTAIERRLQREQREFDALMTCAKDLLTAAQRAAALLERMESDGGARLPYADYRETRLALRAAIKQATGE